jgi:hypothetical protein
MDMEAQVLEIIRELQQSSYEPSISIKEITARFAEKHGEDYERKITPHWIGFLLRKKLGLKTEQQHGGYMIAAGQDQRLVRLFEKYGVSGGSVDSADSVDFTGANDSSIGKETPIM